MSDASEQGLIESLTEREQDVLSLLAEGKSNREIANQLVLSLNTVKWYARQIYGKLGVGDRQEAVERALAVGLLPTRQHLALPPHNLPTHLTPFVGRQEELAALRGLLADPAVRLLSVVGPGGIGKTRLALQVATGWLHHHPEDAPDGVYLASLAEVAAVDGVGESIARITGLKPLAGEGDLVQRLIRYLREKRTLLLLDGVEHLAGQALAGLLDTLLRAAPGIAVMATSRQRLDVQGEYLFWVEGLRLPPAGVANPEQLLGASSALALFLQTARRVRPGFGLTAENAPAVIGICRLVEGMPLGIELAAGWTRVLEPNDLLAELERTPDLLASKARNVPADQGSLRAVFDTSWRLLSESERRAARALSFFPGGFTRAAAEEICDVGLPDLLALVDKCWLKQEGNGRFSIHELLRQYGLEALAAAPEEYEQVRRRHSTYYCKWLSAREKAVVGPQQAATLAEIEREMGNISIACLTAAESGAGEDLLNALNVLGIYYQWHAGYAAGDRMFEALLREADDSAGEPPATRRLRARILAWRTRLQGLVGLTRNSRLLAREAVALIEQLEASGQAMEFERMLIAVDAGYYFLQRVRDPEQALHRFSVAQELAQLTGSRWYEAMTLLNLARARRNLRNLEAAQQLVARAIVLLRESGSERALADAVTLRANILMRMGKLAEAETLLQEKMQLSGTHPEVVAFRLLNVAWVRFLLGQFDRAEAAAGESLAEYQKNGIVRGEIWARSFVADSRVHQGSYTAAVNAMEASAMSVTPSWRAEVRAYELYLRGVRALVARAWEAAGEHLQQSLETRAPKTDQHYLFPHACLAMVARGAGRDEEAGQELASELRMTLASRELPALMLCLSVGALLLADRGDVEQAAELYFRLREEPFARNSVWLQDVAGQALADVSTRLPTEAREAAQAQGQKLDLWETVAALRQEI